REHQVAHLIALGLSTKVVAARLGISIHTVRHHIERVYAKMGLHTRAEIARALVQSNVSPEATSLSEDEHRSPCDAASVSFSVLH
ncbi:MAG: helix-turn-helix transcriptional regulator, partial [Gemmatimonadaceae bacterium]